MDNVRDLPEFHDDALADPAFGEFFAALRAMGEGPVPPVGDELRAVLSGATPLSSARTRRKTTLRRAGVVGFMAAGVMAGGLGVAAANGLPAPAQRIVSEVVNKLTPFNLPRPGDQVRPQDHRTSSPDGSRSGTSGSRSQQNGDGSQGTGNQPGADENQPGGGTQGTGGSSQTGNDHQGGQTPTGRSGAQSGGQTGDRSQPSGSTTGSGDSGQQGSSSQPTGTATGSAGNSGAGNDSNGSAGSGQ